MVPNQLLTLDDSENTVSDHVKGLTSQLRELEKLALDSNFDGQLLGLGLDVSVEDSLAQLVHNHDPGHILLPLWCSVRLT